MAGNAGTRQALLGTAIALKTFAAPHASQGDSPSHAQADLAPAIERAGDGSRISHSRKRLANFRRILLEAENRVVTICWPAG